MEANMPNSLRQFFLAAATVAALTMTGCAFAQTPSERTASVKREVLVNRDGHSYSETDFRLQDHQQLKAYFQRGTREPFR
jgi:hypothetical protein